MQTLDQIEEGDEEEENEVFSNEREQVQRQAALNSREILANRSPNLPSPTKGNSCFLLLIIRCNYYFRPIRVAGTLGSC